MHEAQTGLCLQERYERVDLLGQGGFSSVYLVRDQQKDGKLFALKELTGQSKQEKSRFFFEGELLGRLNHPSLPEFYGVFEHEQRAYLLMEYIDGPNLETLRKQQPGQRFALKEVLRMLAPVVGAISYLHQQPKPIIHRDIKPSNIIAPPASDQSFLVDFGIAKEYHPEETTTAIRHCSPGYGAPEQYSSNGTDQRTDVYGLGATCYVLLTGTTPADALHRATTIASKGNDPLLPLDELEPTISPAVVQVIHGALAMNNEQRFATVLDFWHALLIAADTQPGPQTEPGRSLTGIQQPHTQRIVLQRKDARSSAGRARTVLAITIALFLLISIGVGTWSYTRLDAPGTTVQPTLTPPVTTPTQNSDYPLLAKAYTGSIHNLQRQETSRLILTEIEQNQGGLKGQFTGQNRESTFTGVIDLSKHVLLTVQGDAEDRLFLEGILRADGHLAGNYCHIDRGGQCVGEYGLWTLEATNR